MALLICPDCGHEVSAAAVACANCGRPMVDPTIERNVVITEAPAPVRDDFPKWIFIPIAALGALLLLFLFVWMRNNDDTANTNINVNVARSGQTTNGTTRDTTASTRTEVPNQVTIPPSDTTTVSTPPPSSTGTSTSTQPSSVTRVPGESVTTGTDKGVAVVTAKVSTRTGGVQPVRNEKFYLLDKDLEEILDDANLDNETGQGLRTLFGMSVLYPDRYGDTRQKALSAISQHTKYTALTDASGKAQLKDIKPDTYYLFGITKTRNGFAIWSSPVTIQPGQNLLDLGTASITEAQ